MNAPPLDQGSPAPPAARVLRGEARLEVSPPAEPERFYRPELDALRFFAFAAVFAHHCLPTGAVVCRSAFCAAHADLIASFADAVRACGAGLPLFFTLSAFLIGTLLARERAASGSVRLGAFYLRRVLRIWPLYYAALAIALTVALVGGRTAELPLLGAFAGFGGDWFLAASPTAAIAGRNVFSPLWSISVEEQFYLVVPLALALLPRARPAALGFAVVAASLAALYVQGRAHLPVAGVIWYDGFSQAIFLGAGLLLADALGRRAPALPGAARVALVGGSVALAYAAVRFCDVQRDGPAVSGGSVALGYSLVALACVGVVVGFYGTAWRFPGWLVYLGKISFGLYVFHVALMAAAVGLLALAHARGGELTARLLSIVATVAVAALSYERYEKPFLRLKRRFA